MYYTYYPSTVLSQWSLIALLALLWFFFALAYCRHFQRHRRVKRFLLKHFNKMALPVGILGAAFYFSLFMGANIMRNYALLKLLLALEAWLLAGVIYCSWQMFKQRKRRSGARVLRIMLAGTLTFLPMLVCFIGYFCRIMGW